MSNKIHRMTNTLPRYDKAEFLAKSRHTQNHVHPIKSRRNCRILSVSCPHFYTRSGNGRSVDLVTNTYSSMADIPNIPLRIIAYKFTFFWLRMNMSITLWGLGEVGEWSMMISVDHTIDDVIFSVMNTVESFTLTRISAKLSPTCPSVCHQQGGIE